MDLITLQTFDNYFTANIQLTRLRAAGIECYLKDEYTVTIDPILSNAIGGIKLVIRKGEERKVKKILNELNSDLHNPLLCAQCGSRNFITVAKKSPQNIIAAISTWLLSYYAVSVANIYQCSDCAYESEALPEDPAPYN